MISTFIDVYVQNSNMKTSKIHCVYAIDEISNSEREREKRKKKKRPSRHDPMQ